MYSMDSFLHLGEEVRTWGRRPLPRAWPVPLGAQSLSGAQESQLLGLASGFFIGPWSTVRSYKGW